MSSKRASLRAALTGPQGAAASPSAPALSIVERPAGGGASAETGPTRLAEVKPSRRDLRQLGGYWHDDVQRQLKILSAEVGVPQQTLLTEALNLLFRNYNKPEIATDTPKRPTKRA